MLAAGTVLAVALGVVTGWRGGVRLLLLGLFGAGLIAFVQYRLLHSDGVLGEGPELPWGAVSLVGYAFGAAFGAIVSSR